MFKNITEVKSALAAQQYIATDEIATVIFLADKLQKPVLVEGPAGVGKTELGKAWACVAQRELIRLQCYEGLDETKALYEWEYAKQMLYTQLLRDKLQDVLRDARTLTEAADKLAAEEDVFFSQRFLLPRPLLRAVTSDQPVALLIDEIDRADAEFEAFLLEVLSDFQVSVPEIGTIKAKHMPTVILTSNNTRELSEALKRRCLYLFIDYPTSEAELRIVKLKVPDLAPAMAQQAVDLVQRLRKLDLKKHPSVSETIDWARALVMLNSKSLDSKTLETTLSVLLKHEHDIQRAQRIVGEFNVSEDRDDDEDRGANDLRKFRPPSRK
ncbi:MAG: MoxR family ATPase [Chloroflexi bacterium]|nr:MoxR family ATPase [Chloroflexota bacterium]